MKKTIVSSLLVLLATMLLLPALTLAAEAAAGVTGGTSDHMVKFAVALATGLGLGLAVIGGALGQGKAAAPALEGIARNPGAQGKIVTPMIIGLAMIESLVIYSLVISFLLLFMKL